MLVDRTVLPKIGYMYGFTTAKGQRAAVVAHRDGRRDLVLFDHSAPDRTRHTVALTGGEPGTVAQLLGSPVVIDHVAHLTQDLADAQAPGLQAIRVPIPATSPYAGRALGDLGSRTGACVVAVLRGDRTVTAPPATFGLRHGDAVVAVGDASALAAVRDLLTGD
ncbi:cation:proton antiporter regulatory subunit [Actinomadura viridis]|uniref:TrkA domain protein n=1 Tax=Actinomadura viridis TaxID=58110 RepID=A0A931DS91_9ACTN|nr:cation:proton antiporter regulatory subunit [Actinomadura viridis]MBG6091763.1 TrkA domain protein [Actinomadura viridis]